MGQARELMDRATTAIFDNDMAALREVYSPDVVAQTPDAGTLNGVDQLVGYMATILQAFPDMEVKVVRKMEDGKYAIDEGVLLGTNTGPLAMPDGQVLPATGKPLRMRSIDVATVQDGAIVRHDFYFDQMEMIQQLGLFEQPADT